ncbi:MAG TPA: ATP-binding protein [Vicinamibacterales bacterium]|nr:ATP-binding protein [Vicinamibacterales bacterium]
MSVQAEPVRTRVRARAVLVALIALLPAAAAIVYMDSHERTLAAQRLESENLRLMRVAATQEAAVFDGARRLVQMIAAFPAIRGADVAHCSDVLRGVTDNQPDYYNVLVSRADGRLLCGARPVDALPPAVVRERSWFKRVMASRQTAVGTYEVNPATGEPTIAVAHPVLDRAGQVERIVVVSLALNRLGEIAADAGLPRGSTLTLLDRTGTVLARVPDGDRWVGKRRGDTPVLDSIINTGREAAGTEPGIDGISRFYVGVPVRTAMDAGLVLGLGVAPTTIFAEANHVFVRYFWLLAFVSLASLTTAAVMGHVLVVKPVAALAEANRRAADDLRETETRYQQLFENNPQPMWVYDRHTLQFLEVNEAAIRAYGYSREEFLAMGIADIRPVEDVPRLEENLASNREPWARERGWRHRLKSGAIIDVEIASHLFTFAGADAELIAAIDVTDRRRAEEALAERTSITALAADVGVSLNLSHDLRRCLLRCAEAVAAHVDTSFVRIRTIAQPDDLDVDVAVGAGADADALLAYQLALDKHVVGEMTVARSGAISETMMTGLAAVGDIVALGIERHIADRARRDAEARMAFALAAAGVGVWEAHFPGPVVYWSETTERMHGLAPGTFGGTDAAFFASIHDEDRPHVEAALARARHEHRAAQVEYRALWPDGSVRHVAMSGRYTYSADGRLTSGAGIALDMTDRRSLEDQLRQAQKMEAVGQLAGGIAHDFNNLLTAIQGFAGMLAESFAPHDERTEEVAEIQRAADRAAALTRQLLAFSRKQIMSTRIVRVGDVVNGIAAMLQRLLGETVQLSTVVGDAAFVKTDPSQLEQVLLNLAVNARDAMPQGGCLTIETSDVMLDEAFARQHPSVQPGPHVKIAVTDTGCGMDPATQKRIFEPFFTTKPKDRGTGLGLATVYGIVKQTGGSIWVASGVGRGTTFTVYLPQTEERPQPKRPAEARPPTAGAESILVVEDEPLVREYVCNVLSRRGYRVHAVEDPERALSYAGSSEAPIDLVFTDVVLPVISGPAMVDRLRQRHPESRVLYMSGYVDQALLGEGRLEAGAAFLQKPFTPEALANKVRDVLDGRAG